MTKRMDGNVLFEVREKKAPFCEQRLLSISDCFRDAFFYFFGKEKRGNRIPSQREGLKDLINEKRQAEDVPG